MTIRRGKARRRVKVVSPTKAAPITTNLRAQVYALDAWQCVYCGYEGLALSVDHVVPQVQGGQTELQNSVTACRSCNSRKGGRTPQQAGMPFRFGRYYKPDPQRQMGFAKYFGRLKGHKEAVIVEMARRDGLRISELAWAYGRWRSWSYEHSLSYLIRTYRRVLLRNLEDGGNDGDI